MKKIKTLFKSLFFRASKVVSGLDLIGVANYWNVNATLPGPEQWKKTLGSYIIRIENVSGDIVRYYSFYKDDMGTLHPIGLIQLTSRKEIAKLVRSLRLYDPQY